MTLYTHLPRMCMARTLALHIPERGYFPSNLQAQPTENTRLLN